MKLHPGRRPDFNQLAAVLEKKKPQRDTLFEFFLNGEIYHDLTKDEDLPNPGDPALYNDIVLVKAFENAGYDYATINSSGFHFNRDNNDPHTKSDSRSRSINAGHFITNREEFDKYIWNDPDAPVYRYNRLEQLAPYVPEGMKLMASGPDGVLENVIGITGYDNLCMMVYEDPQLVYDICENVGKRLLRHYEKSIQNDVVGIVMSNDDWGFNTQTLLSPNDMRKYIFPWHKEIVKLAHKYGKYCVLHSCGYYNEVINDVIDDMGFDGRHSYEDVITPVEKAYDDLHGRIAILGGIDVDLMTRGTTEQITKRSKAMLAKGRQHGGYALGTGNSVANYVPKENYYTMVRAIEY